MSEAPMAGSSCSAFLTFAVMVTSFTARLVPVYTSSAAAAVSEPACFILEPAECIASCEDSSWANAGIAIASPSNTVDTANLSEYFLFILPSPFVGGGAACLLVQTLLLEPALNLFPAVTATFLDLSDQLFHAPL